MICCIENARERKGWSERWREREWHDVSSVRVRLLVSSKFCLIEHIFLVKPLHLVGNINDCDGGVLVKNPTATSKPRHTREKWEKWFIVCSLKDFFFTFAINEFKFHCRVEVVVYGEQKRWMKLGKCSYFLLVQASWTQMARWLFVNKEKWWLRFRKNEKICWFKASLGFIFLLHQCPVQSELELRFQVFSTRNTA